MRAGVVGAFGGMGGWLTRQLRGLGYAVEPLDTRSRPLDFIDELDLVVVSVPISATPAVIRAVASHMKEGAVLAEVASLKAESHAALVEAALLGVTPLCVHPMFGPSTRSLIGRVVAVVTVVDAYEEEQLTGHLLPGSDIITLDATRHDRLMAAVLSLPYAVNLAFARVFGDEDLALASRMAGSTFALQYTLAQSVAGESQTLTRDLLNGNASLDPLLRAFTGSLGEVVDASCDVERFAALHSEIVEGLSRDPSYTDADARRQKAHMAISP